MNLPNSLTISRFILAPIYIICFLTLGKSVAFYILLLAGFTDILDGYFARKWKQTTATGALLDPLADKIFVIIVMVMFAFDQTIHWLLVMLVCLREVLMIFIGIFFYLRGQREMSANHWGKSATIFYYVLFAMVVFEWIDQEWTNLLFSILLLFLLVTSFHYTKIMLTLIKKHTRG